MDKKIIILIIAVAIIGIIGVTLVIGMQIPSDEINGTIITKFDSMQSNMTVGQITSDPYYGTNSMVFEINRGSSPLPPGTIINEYTNSTVLNIEPDSDIFANTYTVEVSVNHNVYQVGSGSFGIFEIQNNKAVPEGQSSITDFDENLQPLILKSSNDEIWSFKLAKTNDGRYLYVTDTQLISKK